MGPQSEPLQNFGPTLQPYLAGIGLMSSHVFPKENDTDHQVKEKHD